MSKIQFSIDEPVSWKLASPRVVVRGWCFDGEGEPIGAVRLRAGSLTLNGVVGLLRPDVKAALPAAPSDKTGFEIRGLLSPGKHEIRIEAQFGQAEWREIFCTNGRIKRRLIPHWLGGGNVSDLIAFQMPVQPTHPPRPLTAEKFPAARASRGSPRFAIVTPSFKQGRFLEETMRSVLEQPNAGCGYVVQDGGSTDGSVGVIKGFADELADDSPGTAMSSTEVERGLRTRFERVQRPRSTSMLSSWVSEPDRGQPDAIVRGFARTRGEPTDLMAWLNSDDFYLPGALGFVADYFARHPEVDAIYSHRIVVNEASQEIARWYLPPHDDAVLRLMDFVPQETLFWRRRIWDKVGGLDPTFNFAMDWDLLLRFQAAGARIVRVPHFLACFRVHAAQKTSAAMHDVGQSEIDSLRARTHGRVITADELERDPALLRYLRRSAFIQFLSQLGWHSR